MKYRNVGKWGIKVSEIALGAWTTYGDSVEDLSVIKKITQVAYEGGVNFFDNADVYALGKG
ncbi:MAG: aldo/keto reductase, partial [Acidimicrobiia bacterium]|nr:aldo/keto reductase [Acidimicrobiia bacterium]